MKTESMKLSKAELKKIDQAEIDKECDEIIKAWDAGHVMLQRDAIKLDLLEIEQYKKLQAEANKKAN